MLDNLTVWDRIIKNGNFTSSPYRHSRHHFRNGHGFAILMS